VIYHGFGRAASRKHCPLDARKTSVFSTNEDSGADSRLRHRRVRGRRELLRQCVPNEVGFQMTPLPDYRSEPLAQLGQNRRFYPGRAAGRQPQHHNGDKVFARRCVRR